MLKVYVVINSDYRFIDVKATRKEAEQLVKELEEGLEYIGVAEVAYSIKEKEL